MNNCVIGIGKYDLSYVVHKQVWPYLFTLIYYYPLLFTFRVLELERKKEAVKAAERISMEVDADVSSGEEDFDEFLDWRAKKSYRQSYKFRILFKGQSI